MYGHSGGIVEMESATGFGWGRTRYERRDAIGRGNKRGQGGEAT
jgi:hypothetical protein